MKPFHFIDDLINQLQNFSVTSVHLELHVGGNGMVGDGNSVLEFDLEIPKKESIKSLPV